MLMTLLGMIPGLSSMVTSLTNSFFNAKVAITTARIGGDVAVAKSLITQAAVEQHARVSIFQMITGSKMLTLMLLGFALPLIIFEWKVVVWDIVFGWGSTDPIRGQVADWANTIIAFIFGSTTLVTIGSMWINRKDA